MNTKDRTTQKQIVITGGTGLIGSKLTEKLKDNYKLIILTRNPSKYKNSGNIEYTYWDGKTTIPDIINGSHAIINLIGENIGKKRWTKKEKSLIVNSRQDAAVSILESIKHCDIKPKLWLQASATGYYGQETNVELDESSKKAENSFLADVCELWEKSINDLDDASVRKVIVRTGVVLASNSYLWKQLTLSFKFGVAAIPGSGNDYLPWIHIDDEVDAIVQAVEDETYMGIFNLCSPLNCTMKELVLAIKSKKKSFITLPIPAFFLEILFGQEMTKEVILTDQKVIPRHLLNKNFKFTYSNIDKAVANLS